MQTDRCTVSMVLYIVEFSDTEMFQTLFRKNRDTHFISNNLFLKIVLFVR